MKLPDLHNKKTQLALGGAGAVAAFALYKRHAAKPAAPAATGGGVTASQALNASSIENAVVSDLQPQIDKLAGDLSGLEARKPVPGPPGPPGKPGAPPPKPPPPKPPAKLPPLDASKYWEQIPLNNTPANEALTILGTIGAGGVYMGHNVSGGAPVYAVLPQYGVAIQDFNAKNMPPGTKLATLKSLAAYILPGTVTENL